jgi:hypothetical protein
MTTSPTSKPTSFPSLKPTSKPTPSPTSKPTSEPTSSPTSFPTSVNLLTNSGAETGAMSDWTTTGCWNPGTESTTGITPYSGSYAFFCNPGGASFCMSQSVTLLPGSTYIVSFWFGMETSTTACTLSASMGGFYIGPTYYTLGTSTFYSRTITTNSATQTLKFCTSSNDSGCTYNVAIDAISINFVSSPIPTLAPSVNPSAAPSNSPSAPSATPSNAPSIPSISPSAAPSLPTSGPTLPPTSAPSRVPTNIPSRKPSSMPSSIPSAPSSAPTTLPSRTPTSVPSNLPSAAPSFIPISSPTVMPLKLPTEIPSYEPSGAPTALPTSSHTSNPTAEPSSAPSITPSIAPTSIPSAIPSIEPTSVPSNLPSTAPSSAPSFIPISSPTVMPSRLPTSIPSYEPTSAPSSEPTPAPSNRPTLFPTAAPSTKPTSLPTIKPTKIPTITPTVAPSFIPSISHAPMIVTKPTPSMIPTNMPSSFPTLAPGILLSSLGTRGFSVSGSNINDQVGRAVDWIGDINGDGIDDFIIEVFSLKTAYVVYGPSGERNNIKLSELTSADGFSIKTADMTSYLPTSWLGDINHDGIIDFAIASPYANQQKGIVYIIYGQEQSVNIDLDSFSKEQGFTISGANINDRAGTFLIGLGDINNDNNSDFLMGAPNIGKTYVILGKEPGQGYTDINLNNFDSEQGFTITGVDLSDSTNQFAARMGDINGDNIPDYAIGLPNAASKKGMFYVLYGGNNSLYSNIDLDSLSSTQGFTVTGANINDQIGSSFSEAGDINDDGIDDFIIGSYRSRSFTGIVYVIYGKLGGLSNIDLSNFSSEQGFTITGPKAFSFNGYSVVGNIDANKDGISDIVIGTPYGTDGRVGYIIYGSSEQLLMPNIDLTHLSEEQGLAIVSSNSRDKSGFLVKSVGDIDQDGFNDFAVTAPLATIDNIANTGALYFITNIDGSSTNAPTQAGHATPRPSRQPHSKPTLIPSKTPTNIPTTQPSIGESETPSIAQTETPSIANPTNLPTGNLSETSNLTIRPTAPTPRPTAKPSKTPTNKPSSNPTLKPTFSPSESPSSKPTKTPNNSPSKAPSVIPTDFPSMASIKTTDSPIAEFTLQPTSITPINGAIDYLEIIISSNGKYIGSEENENFIIKATENVVVIGAGGNDKYTIFPYNQANLTILDFNPYKNLIDLKALQILTLLWDPSLSI